MSDPVIKLTSNEYELSADLPVLKGSEGPHVMDIRSLHKQTGMFTYDPGFTSTASCESKITYIDGDEGILMYRGYPIDELAEHGDFIETCYLLLYGNLPTASERKEFETAITYHTMIHEQMQRFFAGFRRDAHPMAVMVGVVGAMSAFYHDSTDISDPVQREIAARRMIAKIPTIAAAAYKYHIGQPFVYPRNDLDYSSNFLRMCFAVPCEDYKVNPILSRAISRAAWALRIAQGKLLSVARLLKALFTFDGGLDYIAWKLERHSGVPVEIPDKVRRYPLIFVWGLFWKLYRRGVFR